MSKHRRHLRWRKVLQYLLRLCRELLIGKASAVVLAWELKNAIHWTTVVLVAEAVFHVDMQEVDLNGSEDWIRNNQAEGKNLAITFSTFTFLLLFAAFLAWSFTHCPCAGCFGDHRQATEMSSSSLVLARHQTLADMQQFYIGGIAFLPAWAYKDLVEKFLVWATRDEVVELLENTTSSAAESIGNATSSVVTNLKNRSKEGGDSEANATADSDASASAVAAESAQDGEVVRALAAEAEEQRPESDDSATSDANLFVAPPTAPHLVANKTQAVMSQITDQYVCNLWNVALALGLTVVAAALQIGAHTAVEGLDGSGWDYVKQVLSSLQTCMGLGTGFAFWNILQTIFGDHIETGWENAAYAVGVTLCVSGLQHLLRKWGRSEHAECMQKAIEFADTGFNFVIAWAWKGLLGKGGSWLATQMVGELEDGCHPLDELHSAISAVAIALLGIAVVALVELVGGLSMAAGKSINLIAGINIGWAGMDFASSFFNCDRDRNKNLGQVWLIGLFVFIVVLTMCVLLELGDHMLSQKIQEMRKEAGTLEDDDDSYWRDSGSSEDGDDSSEKESSEEDEKEKDA